jgi:hypothetical protein
VDGKLATGVPQPDGSGEPLEMSDGMEERGNHQTLIPVVSHFTDGRWKESQWVVAAGERALSHGIMTLTRINTTSDVVESCTVRIDVRLITYTATLVASSIRRARVRVVVSGGQLTGHRQATVRHVTTVTGVQGDLVLGKCIDTFEDIDFTTIRPVGTV